MSNAYLHVGGKWCCTSGGKKCTIIYMYMYNKNHAHVHV